MGRDDSRAAAKAMAIADMRDKVAKHGWGVVGVFPTPGDPGPGFAYTVGLSEKGLPELVMYGLPTEVAHDIVNMVAKSMVDKESAPPVGEPIYGVASAPLMPIGLKDATDLSMVCSLYGSVASAIQLVWPDKAGAWPWDEHYSISADKQPILGYPPQSAGTAMRADRIDIADVASLAELLADQSKQELSLDGVDARHDNTVRAGWAARALVAYATHLGRGHLGDEPETVLADLLSDLHHLADALGVAWIAAAARAERYYGEEIAGGGEGP